MQARSYLEIGVERGLNFLQIRVPLKLAVDPHFEIPGGIQDGPGMRFFELTSDEFFANPPSVLTDEGCDVVFVDGLHSHAQALRDVENSLRYLSPKGVILVHDCLPASEIEASPSFEQASATPGFDGNWTGDVYKTIVRLRASRPDLFVCVLDVDHGVGLITTGKPENRLTLGDAAIEALNFADLKRSAKELLNLKPLSWFQSWLRGRTVVGREV